MAKPSDQKFEHKPKNDANCNSNEIGLTEDVDPSRGVTPEVIASWWSRLTFSWFNQIMDDAYSSNLRSSDYYDLPDFDTPTYKLEVFKKFWKNELERCGLTTEGNETKFIDKRNDNDMKYLLSRRFRQKMKPSLIRSLLYTFKMYFIVIFILVVLADSSSLAQTIVLKKLLLYIQNSDKTLSDNSLVQLPWWVRVLGASQQIDWSKVKHGLILICLMTLLTLIFPILKQQEYRLVTNVGRYSRSLVSGFIYRKLMNMDTYVFRDNTKHNYKVQRLSLGASSTASSYYRSSETSNITDNVVNLLGNDAARFSRLITAHLFYSGIFIFVACTVLLYIQLGISALFGILFVILNVLISVISLHYRALERKPYLESQDNRIRSTNEYLSCIKVIKCYAWEDCFVDRIQEYRNIEIKSLIIQGFYRALSMSIYSTPMQATLVTAIVYTIMGNKLDPATVFYAESLFDTLSMSLSCFPFSYASFYDLILACNRIRDFLLLPEKKNLESLETKVSLSQQQNTSNNIDGSISFEDVDLYWPNGSLLLRDVSFKVSSGEVTAIIGSIGSGKTGLLSAIIGDISPKKGKIKCVGNQAYVAQIPWIQTGTIRDNILFGAKFDSIWYDTVIRVCALWMDFQVLPNGDKTLIGEKGVNLSGGQRQRISLARAVYQKASVYILDDCLSAVDSHVAAHIFKNCICGILSDKCVVLVTHKLDIIPHVDQVVLFDAIRKNQVYAGNPMGLSMLPSFTFQKLSFENTVIDEECEQEDIVSNSKVIQPKNSGPSYKVFSSYINSETVDKDAMESVLEKANNLSNTYNKPNSKISDGLSNIPRCCDDDEVLVDDVVAVDLLDELVSNTDNPGQTTPRGAMFTELCNSEHMSIVSTPQTTSNSPLNLTSKHKTPRHPSLVHFIPSLQVGFLKGRKASIRMSGRQLRYHYKGEGESIISDISAEYHQGIGSEERMSITSIIDIEKGIKIGEEEIELGRVSHKTYKAYFLEWGYLNIFGTLSCHIIAGIIGVVSTFWLGNWSEYYDSINWHYAVSVYGTLALFYSLLHVIATLLIRNGGIKASTSFHKKLLIRLRYTTLSFFEATPVGRILSRFTGDTTNLDDALPRNLGDLLTAVAKIIVIIFSISRVTPRFLICVPVLIYMFYQFSKKYAPMLRQSERLAAVRTAPILSHVIDTLDGLTTIRAFKAQERFIQKMDCLIRSESRIRYHVETSYRWLFIRLEVMGCIAVFTAGIFGVFVLACDPRNAGIFGVSLTFALGASNCLNFGTRVLGEIEGVMVGLERIRDYTESTPLESKPTNENYKLPNNWPTSGKIQFEKFKLKYRSDLPLVLNNISCTILPGEKVGVVGRTGAGKSSIFASILRLVEPFSGNIKIDDIDISSIGLFDLRSRISIIPQDPIIFSGTVRFNLDPLKQHSDEDIYEVLNRTHLRGFFKSMPNGLYSKLDVGGHSLSAGQRQLLCLARAILRRSRVVLLDEATSSVDVNTDSLIQKTLRIEFQNCTILAVAHRIQTVMDYDRIMVLDSGKIVEFDNPGVLLRNTNSIFYSLVNGSS
ncbi:ABC transporter family protein [Cryptosporidium andersoni]|uniref:ABC transporter family protein n=1 Tax=Cryptosporidium andersoni TaxID=117008 RepID=A0A1J4MDK2_9CRYT|nr:ABC transporter family protein [Cryptosporidium andersoni]